jgi:hypothetical protein
VTLIANAKVKSHVAVAGQTKVKVELARDVVVELLVEDGDPVETWFAP